MIKKLDTSSLKMILSNCDETINHAIKDNLPEILHIIPVDYWFELVENDFAEFSHEILKWCNVPRKNEVILTPPSNLGPRTTNISKILSDRPVIKKPYEDFNRLRNMILRRDELWVYNELVDWSESVDENFKEYLDITIMQLHTYKNEIDAHIHNHDSVPEQLYRYTSGLEEVISNKSLKTFSNEVLRARVLYSVEADLQNWNGVPIENVIDEMRKMVEYGEIRNEY